MFEIYEKIHGFESEKTAKICMEIGNIYELSENIPEAVDNYKSSYSIWEKIIKTNNFEVLFTLAIKISELHEKIENYVGAYEILKDVYVILLKINLCE